MNYSKFFFFLLKSCACFVVVQNMVVFIALKIVASFILLTYCHVRLLNKFLLKTQFRQHAFKPILLYPAIDQPFKLRQVN